MLSPGCVRGEHPPPSPLTSPLQLPNERGTKDVCLLALWAQLIAQQCFRNLCFATGAGEGRELAVGLCVWTLWCCFLGDWGEFLNLYLLQWGATGRVPPATYTLQSLWIFSPFLPDIARWDFLCQLRRSVCERTVDWFLEYKCLCQGCACLEQGLFFKGRILGSGLLFESSVHCQWYSVTCKY